MSILDTTAGDFLAQFAKNAAEGITDRLFGSKGIAEGKARYDAQQAAEAERQAHEQTELTTARAALEAYRSAPRRTLEAIAADIEATTAEQRVLIDELTTIENEIQQGDHEPSVKTATRHAQIQLTLKRFPVRFQQLEAERRDVELFQVVEDYHAAVSADASAARELTAFERDEWPAILEAYTAGVQKISRLRGILRVNPISRMDTLKDKYGAATVAAVSDKLNAIDRTTPELNGVIWKP